jgi:hypothetical protein
MKARKTLVYTLKVLGVVAVVLLLATIIISNSSYVQNKIIGLATDAIKKELNAEVQIGHVDINLLGQRASVSDVVLKDQQNRDMLSVKEIWGNLRLLPLLRGRVVLKEFSVSDVDVLVVQPEEGPANYQFILDATKKDKKKKKSSVFQLDLRHALLKHLNVKYNDEQFQLEQAIYSFWRGKHKLTVHHLQTDVTKHMKKDTIDWHFDTGMVTATMDDDGKKRVDIKGLRIISDNHKPRRNTNRPHRGAYDRGHLDITADMGIDILHYGKDSLSARLAKCCISDSVTGIDFKDVTTDIAVCGKRVHLSDLMIQQASTKITVPEGEIVLPDKKKGTSLQYRADSITARVMLKDISQPFAPVLRKFSIPLNLRVSLRGTNKGMTFRGIHVDTDDKKFVVNATGIMRNLDKGRDFALHFDVHDMVAKPGIKDKIINQFTVKKYMMYQVYALGVIKYHGSFDILWRKEQFRGVLNTEKGDIDFDFQLDGNTHYLTGNANTDMLKLGELFELKRIGNIDCSATFSIDYSKKRTAEIRKEKGGKLPIGKVTADIRKVEYRKLPLKNILANIDSDGAVADGNITLKGSLTDLMVEFSFTNTTEMHKMKVKPKLKFRNMFAD